MRSSRSTWLASGSPFARPFIPTRVSARLSLSQQTCSFLTSRFPDTDGLAVCRKICDTSRIPIIMLTARGDVTDRIVGLEFGADDYLPKPLRAARARGAHAGRAAEGK
jgi:DNA-binding response OmpR family regulator